MVRSDLPLWCPPPGLHRFDVLGVGESSLDRMAVLGCSPRPGGKLRARQWLEGAGGQVATAVLACRRLGMRAALATAVGDDPAAEQILAPLEAAGIDLARSRRVAAARSRTALILVNEQTGARTVIWYRDARLILEASELRREHILQARMLHLDASDPELARWAAGVAVEQGRAVTLDVDAPAPGLEELLRRVDFPIVPRAFAEEFFGTRSPLEALRGLIQLGARFPVVTLDAQGAVGGAPDQAIWSPAFPVDVRDTTGAGDAFHGGFLWGLLRGLGGPAILRVANATAAMNCRALGAQAGLPTLEELESFLSEHGRRERAAGRREETGSSGSVRGGEGSP